MLTIKNIIIITFIIFQLSFVTIINGQCLSDDDAAPTKKGSRINLYTGQQNFTALLLGAINKATPNENIFFSPYSTYHALLLAYFGARQQTEHSLRNVLHLNWAHNKIDVMQAYRLEHRLRGRRAANSSNEFNAANKIYVSKEAQLRDCMKDLFDEELETLNFKDDPAGSLIQINKFVEDVTRGNIKDILPSGSIQSNTNLVLANAAYFKGQWASQFDPKLTSKKIFYSSQDKTMFVNMMSKFDTFNHAVNEYLGCHVLQIPYLGENDGLKMVIFLPPFIPNGLENVLDKLTPQVLSDALDEGMAREVELQIPKFSFEKTYQLVPILSQMGIGDLFEATSNLTGFSERTHLSLDDAVHKAKIEINEEGSTAAAATVLFSFRSSRPSEPAQFICNHPFLFLIYDDQSKAVLFSGIYRGPE